MLQLIPNPDGGGEPALPPAGTLLKSNVAALRQLLDQLQLDNKGLKPNLLARLAQEDGRRRNAELARQQGMQQQQQGQHGGGMAPGMQGPGGGGGLGRSTWFRWRLRA